MSDVDAFAAAAPLTAAAEWVVCEAPPAARFVAPIAPLARLDTTRPVPDLLSDLAGVLDARLARQITHEGTPS